MSERLLDHLRKLGARRLYFAGALTKACVMFSANSAFNLGFEARQNSISTSVQNLIINVNVKKNNILL